VRDGLSNACRVSVQRVFEGIGLILGNQRVKTAEVLFDPYFQFPARVYFNGGADTDLIRGVPIGQLARRHRDGHDASREDYAQLLCLGRQQDVLEARAAGEKNSFTASPGAPQTGDIGLR
jgi:hypothetical protein